MAMIVADFIFHDGHRERKPVTSPAPPRWITEHVRYPVSIREMTSDVIPTTIRREFARQEGDRLRPVYREITPVEKAGS